MVIHTISSSTPLYLLCNYAMANRLKKTIIKAPSAEKLNPDKEAEVTVKEVVKDERTTKIAGAVCLLLAAFLFIAFISYFFTWQQDQDQVSSGIHVLFSKDVHADNLLGILGAFISNLFMNDGFGIASFLFCTFFFVVGVNLLFGKKIFNITRNLRYLIAGLIVLSVVFSFFFGRNFAWGGAAGDLMVDWLVKWIGKIGTASLLILTFLAYIIWRFNPTFRLPARMRNLSQPEKANQNNTDPFNEEYNTTYYEPDDAITINEKFSAAAEDSLTNNNRLKNDDGNVVVIMPEANGTTAHNNINFVEKDADELVTDDNFKKQDAEQGLVIDESFKIAPKKSAQSNADMQLEIKDVVEEEETLTDNRQPITELEELSTVNGKPSTVNYEPTLDLSNYKYPSLDLLETHGSEKIVHDPAELEANKNQII